VNQPLDESGISFSLEEKEKKGISAKKFPSFNGLRDPFRCKN
jgi:hypothetical protein